MYVCKYVWMNVCMYACMYVCRLCTYVRMYACTQESPITRGFSCQRTEIVLVTTVRELNVRKNGMFAPLKFVAPFTF